MKAADIYRVRDLSGVHHLGEVRSDVPGMVPPEMYHAR